MTKKRKTLFFDIETGAGVNGFKSDLSVALCICYKWEHEPKVRSMSVLDYDDLHNMPIPVWDMKMLLDFSSVINQADVIVGHYSKGFDKAYLNGRMLIHGLPPHSPVKHIDTCFEARHIGRFSSNRLGHLGKVLNTDHVKLSNGWPEWWMEVGRNPDREIKKMIPYCKGDVLATEDLYHKLVPYMTNKGLFSLEGGCPQCGGHYLQRRGTYRTLGSVYPRFQCQGCGKWCRGTGKESHYKPEYKDI